MTATEDPVERVSEQALPPVLPPDPGPPPTRLGRLLERGQRAQQRAVHEAAEALKVVPALDLVWEMSRRWRRLNGSVLAGHLTYRLFLWFFPFVLIVVGLLGYSASNGIRIADYVDDVGASVSFTETIAQEAAGRRLYVLAIGAFGLAWATAGIIRALHYIYAQAWELPIVGRRGIIQATGRAMVAIVLATVVLFVLGLSRGHGLVLRVGGASLTFVVQTLLITAAMTFLPRRSRTIFGLLPGAATFAACMLVLQLFAQYYLPRKAESSSELYGSLGVALGILFYLWCIATLLVLAAFINAVWYDRTAILAGRPWVADPERLPRWARSAWDRGSHVTDRVGDRVTAAAARIEGEAERRLGGNKAPDDPVDDDRRPGEPADDGGPRSP